MKQIIVFTIFLSALTIGTVESIWCFECTSTQPGCGDPFNWLFHWSVVCKEDNDVCVRIIEKKDADTVITRSCLSTIRATRTDIPPDTYEGCRPGVIDVKLGNYVNNSIKELDIYRRHYDTTEFCFCFLDHRCNGGKSIMSSVGLIGTMVILMVNMLR